MSLKKPVTILTGYLGSGKTTVLNELLQNCRSPKMGIIINDMGSINVDASILHSANVMENNTEMIELSNGCICCTLQDSFMHQIDRLARNENIDRIIVEASGISDPSSIAAGFLNYQEIGLCESVFLDSIVTIADADRIYNEFLSSFKNNDSDIEDEDPDIINLVMDQIEFCSVVVLNKCDLLTENQIDEVCDALHVLQKDAELVRCAYGKVDPAIFFSNHEFNYDRVLQSSAIQHQLHMGKTSVEEEHGITSFLYEERKPLDYERFLDFLENKYSDKIIRAKGYVWFYNDPIHAQLFEQAGRNASVSVVSNWLAALDEENRKREIEEGNIFVEDWDEIYGDRINQIVFIGKNMNRSEIIENLNRCIYNDRLE